MPVVSGLGARMRVGAAVGVSAVGGCAVAWGTRRRVCGGEQRRTMQEEPWRGFNRSSHRMARAGAGRLLSAYKKQQRNKDWERKGEREALQRKEAREKTQGGGARRGKNQGPLHLSLLKIKPDGKCMFRAIVVGLALGKGETLTSGEETREADALRMACNDALCHTVERRRKYNSAVYAAKAEFGSIAKFCNAVGDPRHWGGETELLCLSKMLKAHIIVYRPLAEGAYAVLSEYGKEHSSPKNDKVKTPVRLLYNMRDHYDLLV